MLRMVLVGKESQKAYMMSPFTLTCRKTHGNNDFCVAGGEGSRQWVVRPRIRVKLYLEDEIYRKYRH